MKIVDVLNKWIRNKKSDRVVAHFLSLKKRDIGVYR